jgi:hypothetical protein
MYSNISDCDVEKNRDNTNACRNDAKLYTHRLIASIQYATSSLCVAITVRFSAEMIAAKYELTELSDELENLEMIS